jgi:hypothetical protein
LDYKFYVGHLESGFVFCLTLEVKRILFVEAKFKLYDI